MTKATRRVWARSISTAALTSLGPRAVAAVALTATFAVMAPDEGTLDTGHRQSELPDLGASLRDPLGISGGLAGVKKLTPTDAVQLASSAEELSIPPIALAAYQRAATVLNDADASCRLDWTLVAAIGMVESNHGRFGGSELSSSGLALPAIVGPQLDGAGDFAAIRDTDSGLYDHDTVYDRAVGPMQFLPSTWTFAGADGDGDDRRDPQDIDDAAVATAAFLCAGTEDVSTDSGARAAVYRYNQSDAYVDAVLKIAGQYRNGEFPGTPSVDFEAPSSSRPTVSALPRTPNSVVPSLKPETTIAADDAVKAPVAAEPVESGVPDTGTGAETNTGTETDPQTDSPTETETDPQTGTETDTGTGTGTDTGSDAGDKTSDDETETTSPTDPPATEEPEPTVDSRSEEAIVTTYPTVDVDSVTYLALLEACIAHFATTVPDLETAEDYLRTLHGTAGWEALPTPTLDDVAPPAEDDTTAAPEDDTTTAALEDGTATTAPEETVTETPTASPTP